MDLRKTGALLKALREDKEMTQAQLAERFHVSTRTVSRWETGSNLPDVDLMIELADFYDVDIREIIDGERKSETMDTETKDTLKKVAAYAIRERWISKNRVVASYAAYGAIIAAAFNMLFNKDSMGVLVGVVPEHICAIIIKLVTAAAVVGACAIALYYLGAFDKKNKC